MENKDDLIIDEPYDVKKYDIVVHREDLISELSEDTVQFVKKKIKHYENKLDSEYNLRIYAENVRNDKLVKSKGCFITAIVMGIIIMSIYFGANLGQYVSIQSFSIGDLDSIGALLIYPSYFMFIILFIICIVRFIKLKKDANIMVDPHSMKYKPIEYVLLESKERSRVYEEEIERLKLLINNMDE